MLLDIRFEKKKSEVEASSFLGKSLTGVFFF